MTTLLNYLAVVHDYYLIKTRARESMGHHQHGFVAHDIRQQKSGSGSRSSHPDRLFRLVQQHRRRIVEQRLRAVAAGADSAAEAAAAFAQPAVETAIFQQFSEPDLLKGWRRASWSSAWQAPPATGIVARSVALLDSGAAATAVPHRPCRRVASLSP